MRFKHLFCLFTLLFCIYIFQSCKTTKFVPEGEYLLQKININSDNKKISTFELEPYVKQKANYKTLELFKLPLFIYNLSGTDTTKWINKTLRGGGEPPVIYDSTMVSKTVTQFEHILNNKGYIRAKVTPEVRFVNKKAKIKYNIEAGQPYIVDDYSISINDTVFDNDFSYLYTPFFKSKNIERDSVKSEFNKALLRSSLVKKQAIFDLNVLEEERNRLTSIFRRIGYYGFNKEYIGFVADTTLSNNKVDLEMVIYPFMQKEQNGNIVESPHKQYIVDEVLLYVDYNPLTNGSLSEYKPSEIVELNGYKIIYGERGRFINPQILLNNCYITPKQYYNEAQTILTYNTLAQLRILKNINIKYEDFTENDSTKLRCIITCIPDKKQGISVELEGTNSNWFFGIGAGLGYSHRNVFGGSELFNAKVQAAYEAITPSFSSFNKNYFEIGGETSLTFPRFMFPFINKDLKRRLHASTQFTANYSYQRRPDFFTRTVLSTGVKYLWQNRRNNSIKHSFDLIDVSYVHIPYLDPSFDETLTSNARLYSFTDQFIMSIGYNYSNNNYSTTPNKKLQHMYSLRASVETAGNALSLIAALADIEKDENGSRKIFNTYFAQYIKGNIDYSKTMRIDEKNSFAWRVGGGLAIPYGNYKLIPYQKRFFSGGANSVRGWAVRELGPGSYYSPDANFYNQSGDIRFDANVEYRSKFFWKFELAAFVDAGNIWTVKEYESQEKGSIKLDKFYKEIAFAWGLGLRLDLDFVLIRLDCGWKLYNPADIPIYKTNGAGEQVLDRYKSKWAVTQPFKFKQNTAWHIAVGYPF